MSLQEVKYRFYSGLASFISRLAKWVEWLLVKLETAEISLLSTAARSK